MIKLCFIDIETTGLNREIHEIHQVSGIIVIEDKIKETFDFKIRPSEKCVYDVEALQVHNLTIDDLQSPTRMSSQRAYQLFLNMCQKYVNKYNRKDKFFFVGYNTHFDKDRMSDWFISNGDNYFFSLFWGNHIDVMVLATTKLLEQRPQLENFRLTTVCDALNINIPEDTELPDGSSIHDKQAHDAIYDILVTKALYDYLNTQKVPDDITSADNTPTPPNISDLSDCFLPAATKELGASKQQKLSKSGYPVLEWDSIFPFKKYIGHTVQEIFDVDISYLKWCVDNTKIEFTPEIAADIELYYIQFQKEESKTKRVYQKSDNTLDFFFDNPDALDSDCPF